MTDLQNTFVRFTTAGGWMMENSDYLPTDTTNIHDVDIPKDAVAVQFFEASVETPRFDDEYAPITPLTYIGGKIVDLETAKTDYASEGLHEKMERAGVTEILDLKSDDTSAQIPLQKGVVAVDRDLNQVWPMEALDI